MTPLCARNTAVKTQQVRLVDVFALGPAMAVAGWLLYRRTTGWESVLGVAVALGGVATVLYNAHNYQVIEEALRESSG